MIKRLQKVWTFVALALTFTVSIGLIVFWLWGNAGYYVGGGLAIAVLLIQMWGASDYAQTSLKPRNRRRTATNQSFSLVTRFLGSDKQISVNDDIILVERQDGTMSDVSVSDLYKILIREHGKKTILKQVDWVDEIGRDYLDDLRYVCIQAEIVRQLGNGALVLLDDPGYSAQKVTDYYF